MFKLLIAACLVLLSSVSHGQQRPECVVPSESRIPCNGGNVDNNVCSQQEGQVRCCYSDIAPINCYAPMPRKATVTAALAILERSPAPANFEALKLVALQLSGLSPELHSEIQRRILNLQVGNSVEFPVCAVPTPFCHRSRCNSQNPAAETNPLQCTSDPSCCFDKDLFVYKYIFGPAFMGGAPVCYYGPTSSRYRQIARLFLKWNSFYQEKIVPIFEEYLDTGLDYNQGVLCDVTNLLGSTPFSQTPKCGWRGITKLHCHLKGCCYNDDLDECNYPQQIHALTRNVEFYPELIANSSDESVCALSPTSRRNIYRRLPCLQGNAPLLEFTICPRRSCCADPLALIPQSSDLIFCPYLFQPFSGLPDLAPSLVDCCKLHVCYHLKQIR